MIDREEQRAELVEYLKAMRSYYPEGNKVHRLIGSLLVDCRKDAPRDKTRADAEKIKAEDPNSTISKAADRVLGFLGA